MRRGSHRFVQTSRISYIRVRLCSEYALSTAKLGAELLQTGSAVCSIKRVNLALPIAQAFQVQLVVDCAGLQHHIIQEKKFQM